MDHSGRTVVIYQDPHAEDPRTAFDHVATLACWHHHSELGDVQIRDIVPNASAKEMIRYLRDRGEKVLALVPLYLYEHSGMTMSTSPFRCRWDSGQVGWGYVTKAKAEEAGCVGTYKDPETGETKPFDKAYYERVIREEVEEFDTYLTGRVYGYHVQFAPFRVLVAKG